MFDEGTSDQDRQVFTAKFNSLSPKPNIYFIEGNHEYKNEAWDIDEQMQFLESQGWTSLRDEIVEIDQNVYLLGRKDAYGKPEAISNILKKENKTIPIIVFDHRPHFKYLREDERLVLGISGHTHSGQFFPMQSFNPLAKFLGQNIAGKHQEEGFIHITSTGIGNWGLPLRLGSTREIISLQIEFQ